MWKQIPNNQKIKQYIYKQTMGHRVCFKGKKNVYFDVTENEKNIQQDCKVQ